MTRHLLVLTIDADPDGLSGSSTDRQTVRWDSLALLRDLPDILNDAISPVCDSVPMTWMIRADTQIREVLGSACYLLDAFDDLWGRLSSLGHEIGWHPHLYERCPGTNRFQLCTDDARLVEQLLSIADEITGSMVDRSLFRSGEGWHTPTTMRLIEELGVSCDSTVIPGLVGRQGNPMNWVGAPNQPYYPDPADMRLAGPPRRLLEMPINTWYVQGPDESEPRLRYMNPAVQEPIFMKSLDRWCRQFAEEKDELFVWVLVSHPDEVADRSADTRFYARRSAAVARNLRSMIDRIRSLEHAVEFATVSQASAQWRQCGGHT